MAPSLRPVGRFYAAFYRWSRSTVRVLHCNRSVRRRSSSRITPPAYRPYSTTRLLLRDNGVASGAQDHTALADKETTASDTGSMKMAMREVMRRVPSTVAVLTVHATHPNVAEPLPVGSAISSLTTITLDPPHVSFNIKTPSRTLDAIREAEGLFRVHFLDNSVESMKLAQNFTEGNSLDTLQRRNDSFWFKWDCNAKKGPLPPLITSRGVLASITCRLLQEATVADHVVAIASVNDISVRKNLAAALLYHEGSFKSYTGSELRQHASSSSSQEDNGHDLYYSYPLFPGEAEKKD